MTRTRDINVTVNGKTYELAIELRLLLADFLRQSLGLTGTHVGCEHGVPRRHLRQSLSLHRL